MNVVLTAWNPQSPGVRETLGSKQHTIQLHYKTSEFLPHEILQQPPPDLRAYSTNGIWISSCWLFPEVISLAFSLLSQPSPVSSCPSSGPVISVSTLYYRCLTVSITPFSQAWCECKYTHLLWMSPQVYNLGCQPFPSTCLKDIVFCSFLYAPG